VHCGFCNTCCGVCTGNSWQFVYVACAKGVSQTRKNRRKTMARYVFDTALGLAVALGAGSLMLAVALV
jgi:hypothetical protein